MPPRAAPQNAQQKSLRTTNTISYTGMSSTGGTAPPTFLTKITRKSVPSKSSKSKPKPKTGGIDEIRTREGETLSKGAVRIFKLKFFRYLYNIYTLFCSGVLDAINGGTVILCHCCKNIGACVLCLNHDFDDNMWVIYFFTNLYAIQTQKCIGPSN